VGDRSRGRFATPADSPLQDCSPYSHVHARRDRLDSSLVQRRLCRAVQTLTLGFAKFSPSLYLLRRLRHLHLRFAVRRVQVRAALAVQLHEPAHGAAGHVCEVGGAGAHAGSHSTRLSWHHNGGRTMRTMRRRRFNGPLLLPLFILTVLRETGRYHLLLIHAVPLDFPSPFSSLLLLKHKVANRDVRIWHLVIENGY
jgi:hypothetical protein